VLLDPHDVHGRHGDSHGRDRTPLRIASNSCVDEDLMCVSAEHWLSDVLAKLVNGWPASRLNELLPWASTYTMNAHDPRLAA
jgi:hypothetical protein